MENSKRSVKRCLPAENNKILLRETVGTLNVQIYYDPNIAREVGQALIAATDEDEIPTTNTIPSVTMPVSTLAYHAAYELLESIEDQVIELKGHSDDSLVAVRLEHIRDLRTAVQQFPPNGY